MTMKRADMSEFKLAKKRVEVSVGETLRADIAFRLVKIYNGVHCH